MKEASGEANMTVVTIILIGVVVAVATPLIKGMMSNTTKRSCCINSGGTWSGGSCQGAGQSYDSCVSEAEAGKNSAA